MTKQPNYQFNHGDILKDKITGFQGTVTGRADYLTGCNQYLIVPKVKKDGEWKDGRWFDEQRLEKIDESKKSIENKVPGADMSPTRSY